MATGGHHNDGKDVRQKIEACNNGNNLGDRISGLPWPSLPNNLELNTRSKPTKKQRNREKSRSTVSSENLAHSPCTNSPTNKYFDLCFPGSSNEQLPPAKRNVKVPINQRPSLPTFQRPSVSNTTMENEHPSKDEYAKNQMNAAAVKERLAHLEDCIAQVTSVLQQLKQSEDPRMAEQRKTMEGILSDLLEKQEMVERISKKTPKPEMPHLEQMKKFLRAHEDETDMYNFCEQLLNEFPPTNYEDEGSESDSEPYMPAPMDPIRNLNGISEMIPDEEKANMQNHILEKMKISQEKLTAIKQQHTLLLNMRKNAEEKLASFQDISAELANISDEAQQGDTDWKYYLESAAELEESFANYNLGWKTDQNSGQNVQKIVKNGPKPFLGDADDSNNQGVNQMQVNLDSIKRRLEILQECTDNRNVVELPSPEPAGGENLSDKLLAVHWQRKKLKNKLLELQEKKKASDELMKELSLIKEAATTVEHLNSEDSNFCLSNIEDVPDLSIDDNDGGALEAMRETISQLRGMLNTRSTNSDADPVNFSTASVQGDSLSKQNSFCPAAGKRDNIKKGQSDQFPARRHYEAEGRANEDTDVPAAPPPVVPPPTDTDLQQKKKKLQLVKEKQQLLQAMLDAFKGRMDHIPASVLQAMSSFDNDEEDASSKSDSETATDNEDSQGNDDSGSLGEGLLSGPSVVKDEVSDSVDLRRRQDNERPEASANIDVKSLDELKSENERLLKLHQKFSRLHDRISSPKQNNKEMRSSGEGGNFQKKPKLGHSVSVSNHLPIQPLRQENLLTLQNVESQNRNNSSNIASNSNSSLKKDNINDLSAKFNKPGVPYASRAGSELLCKFSTDVKTFQDPMQNKSQIGDIIKRDRNKLQNYSRNHDIPVHNNSSINSESMDGSSSVMAPDATIAATWGGSSTQENFEDENEAFGSLGDPEDEEGGESMPISAPKAYSNTAQYANYSLDPSTKRRDNRLHKYFKSTQLNQWSSQKKNFTPNESQRSRPPSENTRNARGDEASQATAGNFNSANAIPRHDRFFTKLYEQLDSLKAAFGSSSMAESSTSGSIPCQPVPPYSQENSRLPNFQYPLPSPYCPVPDFAPNYTQHLQLQQQLLLSLSQCYHALYVQQLEIQHLHRCLQQGTDAEATFGPTAPSEDAVQSWVFTPCFLNSGTSSVPFPPPQISPVSAPPYTAHNPQVFAFNSGAVSSNTSSTSIQSGTIPARAVVHPAAQDARSTSETLNNQVAPRTRANNYWDNLRSNSRQNLLSVNSGRSKDGPCASGGPQVRQVHPLIPNESNWNDKSKVCIPPHSESFVSSASSVPSQSIVDRRPCVRPIGYQGILSRSRKANQNKQHVSNVLPDSTGVSGYSPCMETVQPYRPFSEETGLRVNSATAASATSSQSSTQQLPENILSEVSKLLVQNNGQENCLEELLRELCSLRSESLQSAVGAVRQLASRERTSSLPTVRHLENDHNFEHSDYPELLQETYVPAVSPCDVNIAKPTSLENNTRERTIQNWPPATIIPLGRPSTGAITKRICKNSVLSSSCASSSYMEPELQSYEDAPSAIVARVISDLIPFSQSQLMDRINSLFRVDLASKAVELFKNHSRRQLPRQAEFFLQLHQAIVLAIRRYDNCYVHECQSTLLKIISDTMIREITVYFQDTAGPCTDERNPHLSGNSQPDVLSSSSLKATLSDETKAASLNEEQPEMSCEVDSSSYSVPEFDVASGELYVNMSVDDSSLQVHCNGNLPPEPVRGEPSGNCMSPTLSWHNHVDTEDTYECDPGAETEPEVETGTEADLAEADQSPGQQGVTNGTVVDDEWHALQACGPYITAATSAKENSANEILSTESTTSNVPLAVQGACNTEKELTLDDIPTKISALSQEELERQMAEEQEANQILAAQHLEETRDMNLVGNGDTLKDPPTFI